jgi:hypothetical protein
VCRSLLEAAKPIIGIVDEAGLAHLAVVHDIDAGRDLPGDDVVDGGLDQLGAAAGVVGFASAHGAHDVHQLRRSRQTAHMRGQNSIDAALHVSDWSSRGGVIRRIL